MDVSDRPEIEAAADLVESVRGPLVGLGFKRIGFVEQVSSAGRHVSELLVDPSRMSFVKPETLAGRPHASFRTLLEDGTLVDTRNTHRYALLDHLPLLAPYQHHPAAGYLLENQGAAEPEALWARHAERVRQAIVSRRTRARPHNSMALCTATLNRTWRVNERRVDVGVRVGMTAWVAVLAVNAWLLGLWPALGLALPLLPIVLVLVGGSVARRVRIARQTPGKLVGESRTDAAGNPLH